MVTPPAIREVFNISLRLNILLLSFAMAALRICTNDRLLKSKILQIELLRIALPGGF